MVEVYVKSIRGAPSLDETARYVCEAVGSDELFAFGELLAEPKVAALRDSPQHAKFYRLLQLFAYGTYGDAIANKDDLPELSGVMTQKLRQLTLVSMCTRSRCIPVQDAMNALHLENLQELYFLFIGALYKGILQGRVNSQQGTLEITSWKSRDVTDEELIKIREKLSDWIDHCASVADNLRAIASNAENAIVEANINEAKVEEEVRRVRKTLQEEEEQRNLKDYRRPKSQRGKKYP
uniref:PCI domain-containing protein n=1 Tax=Parascaris univalens TaxID=6257 RepID=A0A915BCG4_PARUN